MTDWYIKALSPPNGIILADGGSEYEASSFRKVYL